MAGQGHWQSCLALHQSSHMEGELTAAQPPQSWTSSRKSDRPAMWVAKGTEVVAMAWELEETCQGCVEAKQMAWPLHRGLRNHGSKLTVQAYVWPGGPGEGYRRCATEMPDLADKPESRDEHPRVCEEANAGRGEPRLGWRKEAVVGQSARGEQQKLA